MNEGGSGAKGPPEERTLNLRHESYGWFHNVSTIEKERLFIAGPSDMIVCACNMPSGRGGGLCEGEPPPELALESRPE